MGHYYSNELLNRQFYLACYKLQFFCPTGVIVYCLLEGTGVSQGNLKIVFLALP